MKEVKITTSEPLPEDEGLGLVVKDREALKRAAEELKGMKLPLLDKQQKPTGRFIENIRQKGPYLIGDADLTDDEFISINYKADEKDVVTTLQSNLHIFNAYLTDSPRFAAQRADSVIPVGGNQMSTPPQTTPSPPVQPPASAPSTPPAQIAPPTAAPTGEQPEEVTERSIRDTLAKEQIRSVLAQLNITDEMRGKILAMPLKKAYETMNLFREGIHVPPPPQPTPAPVPAQSTLAPPVAIPPNANAMVTPAPQEVAGVRFDVMTITPPDGGQPHPVRIFNPVDIIGRDRVQVKKPSRR